MVRFNQAKLKAGGPPAWDLVHDVRHEATGRSRPIRLGRHSPTYGPPPLRLMAALTDTEKDQVTAWWAERVAERDLKGRRQAVAGEMEAIGRLVRALRVGTVLPEAGPNLWAVIDGLAAALRDAGMPRPRKAVVTAPKDVLEPLEPTPLEIAIEALRAADGGA